MMKIKVLIVEDQFIEANDLRLILVKAGYQVCEIARSVIKAQEIISKDKPDLVLLDIFLKGKLTGIDLARELKEENIAFVYLSANSNTEILAAAKTTQPYGFLVKPFREKDVLVTLEIAQYLHLNRRDSTLKKETVSNVSPDLLLFESIVGNSHLLQQVFNLIMQVAPVDTSILILGESGTGKEKIAQTIHQLSTRKTRPMVVVNCATLPPALIESELFGHERGAFTGAVDKRIGKFEQASGGTIFLDEIGEMPLELQVKLLRVLQEKEIERIGSKNPTKVDVRIIAATNKNLEEEVAASRFRLDLYYRLNVFPIQLPALRERKEDIPLLCAFFIKKYNQKTGKKITGISDKVLNSLLQYHWPGNIRELDHFIERSVLLAVGNVIDQIELPSVKQKYLQGNSESAPIKTLHENERDYILEVLRKCNGKIWGSDGAAELMKLPPTTLCSKMKKLGIKKQYKVDK